MAREKGIDRSFIISLGVPQTHQRRQGERVADREISVYVHEKMRISEMVSLAWRSRAIVES